MIHSQRKLFVTHRQNLLHVLSKTYKRKCISWLIGSTALLFRGTLDYSLPINTCRWPYVVFKQWCAKSRSHFKVLGAHIQGPWFPRRLNFVYAAYYFQHNYCSFSLLTYKIYISSHAPSRKSDNSKVHSRTVGPKCKTDFMSTLWLLEFGGGSYIFWRICGLQVKA